jgi:galactonate dehydratase
VEGSISQWRSSWQNFLNHIDLFIEEPLLSEDAEGIKGLSGLIACAIALGERLHSRWDVKRFLEDGSVDILQLDVLHCGGISEMRRKLTMWHCPLGPIALAACMQADLQRRTLRSKR